MQAVCGRLPAHRTATLNGYTRLAVAGAPYPALVEESGEAVEGTLYFNINERELKRLSAYEGPEYRRIEVTVSDEDEREHKASTYLYRLRYRQRILNRPWSPQTFQRQYLKRYLRTLRPTR